MKVVALICVALVAYAHALEDDEVLKQWGDFQAQYGKTYRSPVEARKRFGIFKQNLVEIQAHNALFELGEVSYTKGVNQFADWTKDEFMSYVNVGLEKQSTVEGETFKKTENFKAPTAVDWRQKDAVTPVKDQGQCGSCWAFSTTGSIEGQLALVKGKLTSLSEQNLMDCSWDQGNMGCNGGLMTSAFDYVKENGIESEKDYPYEEESSNDCRSTPSKIVTKISDYTNIPQGDEEALQEAIATVGPISVAIDASYELQLYSSGILDDRTCSSSSLNHGVLAVGYGTENGKPYYLVKNSWGQSWGEDGYFRLIKKNNRCGIATMSSYPKL